MLHRPRAAGFYPRQAAHLALSHDTTRSFTRYGTSAPRAKRRPKPIRACSVASTGTFVQVRPPESKFSAGANVSWVYTLPLGSRQGGSNGVAAVREDRRTPNLRREAGPYPLRESSPKAASLARAHQSCSSGFARRKPIATLSACTARHTVLPPRPNHHGNAE